MVKAPVLRAEDPGFDSRLRLGDFFRVESYTSDFKTGTPMASGVTGVWRYRVSAGTGWPGVSIL